MSVLENAVADLASALENLETKLEGRLHDQSATGDDIAAERRHARAARGHAAEASRGLTRSIADLKSLLSETADKEKE